MNLAAWGLLSVVVGTVMLILDGNKYLKTVRAILEAHQLTLTTYFSKSDVPVFTGMEKWLEDGDIKSRKVLMTGLGLIILGTILQLIGSLK